MATNSPLRIGILGAARIAPTALIRPARTVPEASVVAVAARDAERARRFASKHRIATVHPDYGALLADPSVDAIYNPLPNSHHCEWTIRALEAGKHVLCEKPMASNAEEAERMAAAAEAAGRVLVEAFHYRYHPLAARMREIVQGGELGTVHSIAANMCVPLLRPGDIRYRYDLAGGANMDVGSYAINVVRFLAGAEPRVIHARTATSSPKVDRWVTAELVFEDGRRGHITASLLSAVLLRIDARVVGDRGEMRVTNFVAPQYFHRLTLKTPRGTIREKVRGDPTYTCQLRAFVDHVRGGRPMETDARDAIANMRVIDAVYDRAGLPRRGT